MKIWVRKRLTVVISALITISTLSFLTTILEPQTIKLLAAAGSTTNVALDHIYAPVVLFGDRNAGSPPKLGEPDGLPSWGTPIAVSPLDATIWVCNPDSGSVSVIDPDKGEKIVELTVGVEPWSLAISPDGQRVYVVDRAAGTLVVIDASDYRVRGALPVGPEPGAIALSPAGSRAYVTVTSASQIAVVDLDSLEISDRVKLDGKPYGLVITDDGDSAEDDERIYVTHFLAFIKPGGVEATDDSRYGRVTVVDARTNRVSSTIELGHDDHGFPNLLSAIAISGERAWVPHVRAAPDLPAGLTTTVFSAVALLDLEAGSEVFPARLLLNDAETFGSPVNSPVAAIPSPEGEYLYVVLAGSDLVEVIDVSDPEKPRLVKFLPTGANPRGLALSRDGRWGYVMNYLSRSVTILDLEKLTWVEELQVTSEQLDPEVLRGKLLFNNAASPRLSQGSWISCASCHPEGGSDGITWIFPDGPRQTPPLWNSGETLPWHWSAALDEPQDVENTIQIIQFGLGLAPGEDPPLLGSRNAGRSADLDALAAFLTRGIRPPSPPPPEGELALGRSLFQSSGCADCHGGPAWTSSALSGVPGALDPDSNGMVDEVLHEVGTYNPRDVRGQSGYDPPSLLGVGLTPPYLHDGSMPTLEALLASGHPDPLGSGNGLEDEAITALAAFLRSIGPNTLPLEP